MWCSVGDAVEDEVVVGLGLDLGDLEAAVSPEQLEDPARAAGGVGAGGQVPALQRAHHLQTMAWLEFLKSVKSDENAIFTEGSYYQVAPFPYLFRHSFKY